MSHTLSLSHTNMTFHVGYKLGASHNNLYNVISWSTLLFFQITGSPWSTGIITSQKNERHTGNVTEQLQPGTNCTFYVCYEYYPSPTSFARELGRESPASCITGKCCLFQQEGGYTLYHHFFSQQNFTDWHSPGNNPDSHAHPVVKP